MMSFNITIGTRFRAAHADSSEWWVVTGSRGKLVWEAEIPAGSEWAGAKRVYDEDEILTSLRREAAFRQYDLEKDGWWNEQELGSILHYDNGFEQYVRGVVVEHNGERKLRPIALVGKWSDRDLPHRLPNGEVRYPYHANKIVNGGLDAAWRPNVIFEQKDATGAYNRPVIDPRVLKPIDLSLGEVTAEEAETIRLEKFRERLLQELRNPDVRYALNQVQRMMIAE